MTDPVLSPAVTVTPTAPVTPANPAAPVVTDPANTLYPNTQHNAEPATNPPPAAEPAKADSTPKEGEDQKKDEPKKEGAPEKYEDFKLPENYEVDKAAMEKFLPIAKQLNLSQEQAQELVNLQTEMAGKFADDQAKAWTDLQDGWHKAAVEDKEYGGIGYEKNVAVANAALAKFGTPELFKALVDTGVGNHPEFVRVFYRIGKAMSEDTIKTGNAQVSGPMDPAKILFPNQN